MYLIKSSEGYAVFDDDIKDKGNLELSYSDDICKATIFDAKYRALEYADEYHIPNSEIMPFSRALTCSRSEVLAKVRIQVG